MVFGEIELCYIFLVDYVRDGCFKNWYFIFLDGCVVNKWVVVYGKGI